MPRNTSKYYDAESAMKHAGEIHKLIGEYDVSQAISQADLDKIMVYAMAITRWAKSERKLK